MSAAVVMTHVDHRIAANSTSGPQHTSQPVGCPWWSWRRHTPSCAGLAVPRLRCRGSRRRDRALLLLGIAGALRRSERVGLYMAYVTWIEDGLKLLAERSKTTSKAKAPKYLSYRRKG